MTEGNKISLGVGIGIGLPSFLVALISAWLMYRYKKRRQGPSSKPVKAEQVADNGELTSVSTHSSDGVEGKTQRVPSCEYLGLTVNVLQESKYDSTHRHHQEIRAEFMR
jgi:hypothetical protein